MTKKQYTHTLAKSKLRAEIWDKTDGRCWYCGRVTNPWRDFCIDHIVPISKNGGDETSNLVPCCRSCNAKKRDGLVEGLRNILSRGAGVSFTERQMEYLKSCGIAPPRNEKYEFFFEKHGLEA